MTLLVADTSVWYRRTHAGIRDRWESELLADSVGITPLVRLEILYSARGESEYTAIADELDGLRQVPCPQEACERALDVQRLLAKGGGRHHRSVGLPDLLIAAAAELAGGVVWHYDPDYDRIAAVTGQPTEWIVTRGSV